MIQKYIRISLIIAGLMLSFTTVKDMVLSGCNGNNSNTQTLKEQNIMFFTNEDEVALFERWIVVPENKSILQRVIERTKKENKEIVIRFNTGKFTNISDFMDRFNKNTNVVVIPMNGVALNVNSGGFGIPHVIEIVGYKLFFVRGV